MFSDPAVSEERVRLIEGFARKSGKTECPLLPTVINNLCLKYENFAFQWVVKGEVLQYLLNDDTSLICNEMMSIESFSFHLSLQNKNGSIIFSVVPSEKDSQTMYPIYCELYCVETQTQYKRTHLFVVPSRPEFEYRLKKYHTFRWSEAHLNEEQCRNMDKLTFCAYFDHLHDFLLDPHRKLRCNTAPPLPLPSPLPPTACTRIKYRWNLKQHYYDIACNKHCKIYSPNFGPYNMFCLWFKHLSLSVKTSNDKSILFGLQLFKFLPTFPRKGILFSARVNYDSATKPIEFVYFLDLMHAEVDIHKIHKVSWIDIEIELDQ
mmetsp:Transcript_62640/g.99507  ORF Transcript_62640/g.99507 Transcript_62640/m.99507 type:complete len:320 (+) Transcript_62640:80-1039(+)